MSLQLGCLCIRYGVRETRCFQVNEPEYEAMDLGDQRSIRTESNLVFLNYLEPLN